MTRALPHVGPRSPAADLVRWSLAHAEQQLLEHDLGVRSDRPDAVHQLRVTCRRLRSDLRTFRVVLADPRITPLRAELSWLGATAGAARDLEVLRERVRRTAALEGHPALDTAELDTALAAAQEPTREGLLAALGSARHQDLLGLLRAVADAPALSDQAGRRCDRLLPELVAAAWRPLHAAARELDADAPDASWHRARILAKRARYGAELVSVALGADRRAKAAEAAQDLLGEHQDAVVAAARLLELGGADPALALVCGQLAERERSRARVARGAFLDRRAALRLG